MLRRDFIKYSLFFASSLFAKETPLFTTIEKLQSDSKNGSSEKKSVAEVFQELKFYPSDFRNYLEKDYSTFQDKNYFVFEFIKGKNLFLAFIDKSDFKVKKLLPSPNDISKSTNPKDYIIEKNLLKYPLKRAKGSKRGDNKWQRVSWVEAIDDIAKRFNQNSIVFSNQDNYIDTVKDILNIPIKYTQKPIAQIDDSDLIISIFKDDLNLLNNLNGKKLISFDLMATNLNSRATISLSIFDFDINRIFRVVLNLLLSVGHLTPNYVSNTKESLIKQLSKYNYESIKELVDFRVFDELYKTILNAKKIAFLTDKYSDEMILLLDLKDSLIFEHISSDDKNFHHRLSDIEFSFENNIINKISLFSPRGQNIVFNSFDSFRMIETLKDERRIEFSFDLNNKINETNTFCDYILPIDRTKRLVKYNKGSNKITLFSESLAIQLANELGVNQLNSLDANIKFFDKYHMDEFSFWSEILKRLNIDKNLVDNLPNISQEPIKSSHDEVTLEFSDVSRVNIGGEHEFYLYAFDFAFAQDSGYLRDITNWYNPILISKDELERLKLKEHQNVKIKFVDDLTNLEIGHFIGSVLSTNSVANRVLAVNKNLGRFTLYKEIKFTNDEVVVEPDFLEAIFTIDGEKIEFKYNSKEAPIWINPLFSFDSRFHKVILSSANANEKVGELVINYQNTLKVAKAHKDF